MSMNSLISCKNVVKVKFDGPSKQPTKDLDPGNLPVLNDKNLENSNISHKENIPDSPISDVTEQVERKRSISKPPPSKQLQNVILLLNQHNQNCGVDDCATLFLINSEWMETWHRYVISEDITNYPGSIDNWELIATTDNNKCDVLDPVTVEVLRNRANQSRGLSFDGEELDFANELEEYKAELRKNLVSDLQVCNTSISHEDYEYETCRFPLRLNLREDIDFYLLPIEVWQALYGWYGGGPPLPRYLFNTLRERTTAPCNILNTLLNKDKSEKILINETTPILSANDLYASGMDDQIPTVQDALLLQDRLQAAQLRSNASTASLGPSISTTTSFQSMADLTSASTGQVFPLPTVATGRTTMNVATTMTPPLPYTDSYNTDMTTPIKHCQPLTKCHVCQRASAQRCSKCNTIYYCSRECQLLHWKFHKGLCARETKKRINEQKQQNEEGNILSTEVKQHYLSNTTQVQVIHDRAGKVGLANLGNSCYMNSSLQCLSHIKPLTLGFLSQRVMRDLNIESRDGSGGRLAEQYGKLLQELWFESAKPSVSPHILKATLGRMNSEYAGLAQQDAHELIEYLLDKLHEDLNRVKKKPYTERVEGDADSDERKVAEEAWATHGKREDSVVRDVMGSLMRYQLVCPDCNKLSLSYEFHTTLQVAIPRQNTVTRRVVFVPQALHLPEVPPAQKLSNPQAVMDALLATTAFESYDITIDRLSAVRSLREAVKRRISATHLLSSDGDVLLVESAHAPNYSNVNRILKDSLAISSLSEETVIYAYCAPIARPNHVFVFPRICEPITFDNITTTTAVKDWSDLIDCSLVGIPILVSYEKHWTCSRLRYQVLLNSIRFFRPDSELYKKAALALSASMPVQFQLSNELDIRLADLHGGSAQSHLVLTTTTTTTTTSTTFEEYIHSIWETSSMAASGLNALTECKRQWLENCTSLLQDHLTTGSANADTLLTRCFGSGLPSDKTVLIGDFGNTSNPRAGEPNGTMFLSLNLIRNRTRRMLDVKKIQKLLPPIRSESMHTSSTTHPNHPTTTPKKNSTGISLYQCLQEHTKEEVLDAGNEVYCARCKEHKAARKMVRFCHAHLPPVLVLSLKRFEFRDVSGVTGLRGAAHREKIDSFVDFPIDGLDLRAFCQDSTTSSSTSSDSNMKEYEASIRSSNSNNNSNSSTIYDLFAVCNHYGRMGFGHYTAAARDWEGSGLSTKWYSYDDNDVSGPLTPTEIEAEVHSRNAYILFYRQRTCPSTLD